MIFLKFNFFIPVYIKILIELYNNNNNINMIKLSKKIDITYNCVYYNCKFLKSKKIIDIRKKGRENKLILNPKYIEHIKNLDLLINDLK